MKWVLIIILSNGTEAGVAINQISFENEVFCRAAVNSYAGLNVFARSRPSAFLSAKCFQVSK